MRPLSIGGALLASLLICPAFAANCPGNPDALGTSRTIAVNPAEMPMIGNMSYRTTLKLNPKEIVLTFDDGPLPPRSTRVLEILRSECVKATFFLIGRNARHFPEVVREIVKDGHTVGTHSQNHPLNFHHISYERGVREIEDGIQSVTKALESDNVKPLPWFRFPGFSHTAALDRYLKSRGIIAMSADFPADDWLRELRKRPDVVLARAMSRLKARGSGILLLHDMQPVTVAVLPRLLRELKAQGYHVVQMVPSADAPPVTTPPPAIVASESAVAKPASIRRVHSRRRHARAKKVTPQPVWNFWPRLFTQRAAQAQ
jgi:peptidoglycan/xylan/chitin deacetylase (PgdA/CDA1 family)